MVCRNEVIQVLVSVLLVDFNIHKIECRGDKSREKGRITIGLDWTGLHRVTEVGQQAVLYTWL